MTPTYTLSELVHIVEQWFRELFGWFWYWCQAEVMKIKQHKSRVYIDLVQYDTGGNVLAKARGIIWELSVLSAFCRQTGLKIDELEGMTIMMKAKSNFHHQRWFSISISEISAQHTLGQLKQVQQSITQTLKDTGLYGLNHQTKFGAPPMRVAVISSKTSEWLRDFQTVLDDSDLYIQTQLYISAVHGNAAKIEVAAALRRIHAAFDGRDDDSVSSSKFPYDAVCIMRGWWGWEWFVRQNDLDIATLICKMPVPVVVAIWHTSDTSILDEVAHHAAKTPTDAGYFLLDYVGKIANDIDDIYGEINESLNDVHDIYSTQIETRYSDICRSGDDRIENLSTNVDMMRESIMSYSPEKMLQKWYILVKQDGLYISIDTLHSLEIWEVIELQTGKWIVKVKI